MEFAPAPDQLKAAEDRKATIAAIFTTLLFMGAIAAVLMLWVIATFEKKIPTISVVGAPSISDTPEDQPQQKTRQQASTPATTTTSFTLTTPSPTSFTVATSPVPINNPTMDFGAPPSFGNGFAPASSGGVGPTFFGTQSKGNNIAYVVDFSKSMNQKGRVDLMRDELTKSLRKLEENKNFILICFAGPYWPAGADLPDSEKGLNGKAAVTFNGEKYPYSNGEYTKKKVPFEWSQATRANISKTTSYVRSADMVLGTDWVKPLKAAIEMDPRPDTIFFMTDGAVRKSSSDEAIELARYASRRGITVNATALIEPGAEDGLLALAKAGKGMFSIVEKNGRAKVVYRHGE
ncbi:MAG: hypothetical protein AAF555_01075 [Verrucomicrobiota bacterium]